MKVTLNQRRRGSRRSARRGLTVLIVLALISITLALSYSLLRSQVATVQIQNNANLRDSAERATRTALTIAYRRMHDADWAGVDTTLSGNIGSRTTYQVTYTTGDPSLPTSGTGSADWPYRVTLNAKVTVTDPANSTVKTEHQARAVVRLQPRQRSATHADWSTMQASAVYQTSAGDCFLEVPASIKGTVRMQGLLRFCEDYEWSSDAENRYLGDLNEMRVNGYPDYRPLTGPLYMPFTTNNSAARTQIATCLGVTAQDIPAATISGWNHPGSVNQYQLYPGGKYYTMPNQGSVLENKVLEPDPTTNPLGIYTASADLTIRGTVTIRGTLFAPGDVQISNTTGGVQLIPLELPALVNSTSAIELPVAVIGDDFYLQPGTSSAISGCVLVWDNFVTQKGNSVVNLNMTGRLIAGRYEINALSSWDMSGLSWTTLYTTGFLLQIAQPYFPAWLGSLGYDPAPGVVINPPAVATRECHWNLALQPLYIPHSSDTGLRWDVLEWHDHLP